MNKGNELLLDFIRKHADEIYGYGKVTYDAERNVPYVVIPTDIIEEIYGLTFSQIIRGQN
tara:strand:- start:6111 stop:6290 length:180 start_codon:yes stop_codon:yes gene_type:complete